MFNLVSHKIQIVTRNELMLHRKISSNMGFAQSCATSGREGYLFEIENAYIPEFILMIPFFSSIHVHSKMSSVTFL